MVRDVGIQYPGFLCVLSSEAFVGPASDKLLRQNGPITMGRFDRKIREIRPVQTCCRQNRVLLQLQCQFPGGFSTRSRSKVDRLRVIMRTVAGWSNRVQWQFPCLAALLAAAVGWTCEAAAAEPQAYPSRPVRII